MGSRLDKLGCYLMSFVLRSVKFSRVSRILILLGAALLVNACSSTQASSLSTDMFAAIENFPAGIGRGFPAPQIPAGAEVGKPVQVGDIAPDFALVLPDGRHTSLRALYGQPVVINFWATWCPPCRAEMPELMRAAAADPKLVMLAVNAQEDINTVKPFAEGYDMETPVVLDETGLLQEVYGVRGLPTTFFIDKEGRVAAIYPGMMTAEVLAKRLEMIR